MGSLIYKGRPEDILISKQNASNSIKAKIDIIEPKGREFEIHLDLGEKIFIAVLRKLDSFNIGNEVYFTFDVKKSVYLIKILKKIYLHQIITITSIGTKDIFFIPFLFIMVLLI